MLNICEIYGVDLRNIILCASARKMKFRLKKQEDEIMKQVQQGKHPKPKEGRRGAAMRRQFPHAGSESE